MQPIKAMASVTMRTHEYQTHLNERLISLENETTVFDDFNFNRVVCDKIVVLFACSVQNGRLK